MPILIFLRARDRNLGRLLQLVPEPWKWGPSYGEWRQRVTAARNDPACAREAQDRARVAILTAAARHSRYYRELLTTVFGAGFKPEKFLDHGNWTRIPVLTSAAVAARASDMCTRPAEALDIGSTGGTSGKPVKFYLDRHRSPIEYAFVHDAWSRAGYRAGDPRCVFRGVELPSETRHMHYDAGLAELRCSVFHLTDATMRGYCEEVRRRGIRFIHGYPSAIAIFASIPAARRIGAAAGDRRCVPDLGASLSGPTRHHRTSLPPSDHRAVLWSQREGGLRLRPGR